MQRLALNMALKKTEMRFDDIDAIFAGDLLNQCVGSSYGLLGCNIPYFGLYGACSTSGEGIMLAAVMTTHKIFERCAVVTSSHYCAAERQYRTPIEYGGQRTPTAQWTVTGAGAFIIGDGEAGKVRIKAGMPGRVIDKGINDASNMGAAMAPAAFRSIYNHLKDTKRSPDYYDLILTGDLGALGSRLLKHLTKEKGFDIEKNHVDCGEMIYNIDEEEYQGGSGAGCSAVVFNSYIYKKMREKKFNKVLFVATGALLSTVSSQQGESIPAIAHAIAIENGVL